jgi:nitrogen fixation protein NifU and related proteins
MTLAYSEDIYQENVLDHYKNPRNKKALLNPTFVTREYNTLCGDEVTLFMNVEDEKIVDVGFQGGGCAISQASISMLTDFLKGLSIEKVKEVKEEDVLGFLGVPISHTRMKCALLSLQALKKSLGVGVKQ